MMNAIKSQSFFFLFKVLTEYAEVLQKKSDNHQGLMCRTRQVHVPFLLGNGGELPGWQTVLNITVGFLSPAFSGFQNKDDFLYAKHFFLFCAQYT